MAEGKHSGSKNFGKVLQKTVSRTKEKVNRDFIKLLTYFFISAIAKILESGHEIQDLSNKQMGVNRCQNNVVLYFRLSKFLSNMSN